MSEQAMPFNKRMGDQFHKIHHHIGASPLILWILGAATLLFWAGSTVVQVQTSEMLALQQLAQHVTGVAWGIFMQPYLLLTGQAPVGYAVAWLYGWIVEIITLIFSLALSVAVMKLNAANPYIGKWFIIGSLLLISLNSWADYSSAPGDNWLIKGLIALAVGGMAVIGLPLGFGLIEHGFKEFGT